MPCDHRYDLPCGESICNRLLQAQNRRDRTYNQKGYINGKKESPSSSENTDPRSKTTNFSLRLKDGSFVNYENKGACKKGGPCKVRCSNLKQGKSCYKNRKTCDCEKHGHRLQYSNGEKHRGPYRDHEQCKSLMNKDSHTIEDSSVAITKEYVKVRPEVREAAYEGLEEGAMQEYDENQKTLHLTSESKVNAVMESAPSLLNKSAESVLRMLLNEKLGVPAEPTLTDYFPALSSLPLPTGDICEPGRLGVKFGGGNLLSAGQRQRAGECVKVGSKVSELQVETGVQYRVGVPKTAGIVGVNGNIGVTTDETNTQTESKVSKMSTEVTGVTMQVDVIGIDVGPRLNTGMVKSDTLEHETGWLSSETKQTRIEQVKLLSVPVKTNVHTETCKVRNVLASHEVTTDHMSGKVHELNTYGHENFAIMHVERSGALNPSGEHAQLHVSSCRLGEGGHMVMGAGAAGAVQGVCDVLDGKSVGEAVQDGGSVIAENLGQAAFMKITGLPILQVSSQHAEVTFANGVSVGLGEETRDLHVPEGHLEQKTDGLQLGLGIPGDPLGVIQVRAAMGHTVDHVDRDVKGSDGSQSHHTATYTTDGIELDLSAGNRGLNPVRLGHVVQKSFDESCKKQDGMKMTTQKVTKSDGHDFGIRFHAQVESETVATTSSAEGGVRTMHETFQGQDFGVRTGLVNFTGSSGNFKQEASCSDHTWTSKDGVTHHESFQEHYDGAQMHIHCTGLFGLVDLGDFVTQDGKVISEEHSGTSSSVLKDGHKIESQREEVTQCHGTKHTNNGDVSSENLDVHKVVQEHQHITGEAENTTRDVQSTFDGKHVVNGSSESSHGNWVSQEHLHNDNLDVTIQTETTGSESGPGPADPQHSEVAGTQHHQFSSDSFQIHDGLGDFHSENWFLSANVHGKMHWDENSSKVVFDEGTSSQVTLSAPVNCAIGAVASSALQLVASKGYISSEDVLSLCYTGVSQFGLFKVVELIALKLGTGWLTLGPVMGIWFALRELRQTYNSSALSLQSKLGHSLVSILQAGGTFFLYWFFATNPFSSVFASLARFSWEAIKDVSDGLSGNLDWHFVCENICQNPQLGAAGAGFLGAKVGLALGTLTGPLGMALGAAVGSAVGTVLGFLGWTFVFGSAMQRDLQHAYTFLGIAPDASDQEICKAFRSKALKLHPDKPGGSAEQFKLLHASYQRIVCSRMARSSFENEEHSKNSSSTGNSLHDLDSDSESTSADDDPLITVKF